MGEPADPASATDPVVTEAVQTDPTMSRFDPMLRALLSFGLIEPDGDAGAGRWRLVAAVQRRIQSLVVPAPPVDKLIYFGHRCSSCGEHAPTRFHAGKYVCDACRLEPVEDLAIRRGAIEGPRSA